MSDSVRPHRRQPTRLLCPWDSPGKNTGVGCHFLLQCMKVESESEVAQSCLTPSDPMDCSLPGSSIHGIFRARVLEWGAIAFSHPSSSSQSTKLSSLCYTAASRQLSILYMVMYIVRATLSIHPTRCCPLCSHKPILYIGISIPDLQIDSSLPFF